MSVCVFGAGVGVGWMGTNNTEHLHKTTAVENSHSNIDK